MIAIYSRGEFVGIQVSDEQAVYGFIEDISLESLKPSYKVNGVWYAEFDVFPIPDDDEDYAYDLCLNSVCLDDDDAYEEF